MNSYWTINSLVILFFIGLIIYTLKLKREVAFFKQQEKELDDYSTEVATVDQQMQGIRHDYRNHLQVMSAFLSQEEYEQLKHYLLELTNELNQVDTIIRTGNTMIDSLVNTKLTRAKKSGVNIVAQALAPESLTIDKVDLAVLIGNLLNNALEATTVTIKYTKNNNNEAPDQFIRLYIAPIKNNLYISITNSMTQAPKQNFLSWKAPNRVGYGLNRINQVVDKYDGIIKRNWEEGVFATEITIPIEPNIEIAQE